MVKFSKELEAQLIPEWKDAFVNYRQLKKHINKIKLSRKPKLLHHCAAADLRRPFPLSLLDSCLRCVSAASSSSGDRVAEIIHVTNKSVEDGESEEIYQTELVHLFSMEDEVKEFFEKLDDELNKVNQFYKTKEVEFLERGETLNKQLQILLDLKQILDDRRQKNHSSRFSSGIISRSWSSLSNRSLSDSSCVNKGDNLCEDANTANGDVLAALERNGVSLINAASRVKKGTKKPKVAMRVDVPSSGRTISAVTSMLWEELVDNPKRDGSLDFINRKKVQYAEKMVRGAFVELYKGLGLLKTYSSLNMVAFVKILKKFDKVSNQQAASSYLRAVKRSHFISSDKVVKLMDEVETIFTKHFADSDRKKAMKYLRPQHHKDSHMLTFFVGLLTGCFVSLFVVYAILAHISGIFNPHKEFAGYMETVYPVFSVFALLSLHLFMYGCNLFMWKNTRINYTFIFDFKPSTALKYRDAFFLCTTFMTAVVAAMVIHLVLRSAGFSPSQVDAIPGFLLLSFSALLICPFDIFYRSTRSWFLRIMRNIICSPFYKVLMVDFFMADQLTSQIPLLRHLESTACYFLAGSFRTHQYETCKSGRLYLELAYVVSFSPYYWRAMQCARRWFDESDSNHLANMGKYVSAMIAAGARITYARQQDSHFWFGVVLVTSAVATVYQLYWDYVKDWGLLNRNSHNPWLRDDLILRNKSVYYISMALNLVLRVAWVETVMPFRVTVTESRLLEFFLASLEVIRRGHWNFYRLENEHLNNVGKFRAVKTVPLPFRETDSDG